MKKFVLVASLLFLGSVAMADDKPQPIGSFKPLEAEADSLDRVREQILAAQAKYGRLLAEAASVRSITTGYRVDYDFDHKVFLVYKDPPAPVGSH